MGAAPAGCGAIWPALDLLVSSLYFSFCYLGLSGALGIPNHHGERRAGAASPSGLPFPAIVMQSPVGRLVCAQPWCAVLARLSAEGWLLIDHLRGRAGAVFSSKMFPRAATAIRPAFMSSWLCQRCLIPFLFLFRIPGELVSGLITAALRAPTSV